MYSFERPPLLAEAFAHPSLHQKNRAAFERLEFLGDRVLGLSVAHLLYTEFPRESEGKLAKRLAALVNRSTCCRVAHSLHFNDFYDPLGAEKGAARETILSDTTEALIGALYLDGGMVAAQERVVRLWRPFLDHQEPPPQDEKSALQEWSQEHGYGLPLYELMEQTGPSHAPVFLMQVSIPTPDQLYRAQGQGTSKKIAERHAAHHLLQKVISLP